MNLVKKYTSIAFSALFMFSSVVSSPVEAAKGFSYKVVGKNNKTAILTKIKTNEPLELKDPIDKYSIIEIADNSSAYKQIRDRHMKKRIQNLATAAMLLPTIIGPAFVLGSRDAEKAFTTNISYTGPKITSVNLPNCIKVGKNALVFCSQVKNIDLPKCESLAKGSLYGCTSITKLNIPKCKRINTFFDDTEGKFGSDYSTYERYYHQDYSAFKELNAPSCIEVAEKSLCGFKALKKVNLKSCNIIGEGAFSECTALKTLDLPNCTHIYSSDRRNLRFKGGTFMGCEKLESVNAPELIYAGKSCFENCKSLNKIDFKNLKEIGHRFCHECRSLNTVLLDACTCIPAKSFFYCESLVNVRIPNAVAVGDSAFSGDENIERMDLPNCNSVNEASFRNCKKLCSFNASNLRSIGKRAFEGDESLVEVSFPNCRLIQQNAFRGCKNLKKITVPKSCKLEKDCLPYDLLIDQKLEIVRI